MKIVIGTDHKGFRLKEKVKAWLYEWGYEVEDVGAFGLDPDDDYPDFASQVAEKVSVDDDGTRGIILGATGEGEAIVANKYLNVRASVYYGGPEEIIALARDHSDANILSMGVLYLEERTIKRMVKLWLEKPFSGTERHVRRLKKIKDIENHHGKVYRSQT